MSKTTHRRVVETPLFFVVCLFSATTAVHVHITLAIAMVSRADSAQRNSQTRGGASSGATGDDEDPRVGRTGGSDPTGRRAAGENDRGGSSSSREGGGNRGRSSSGDRGRAMTSGNPHTRGRRAIDDHGSVRGNPEISRNKRKRSVEDGLAQDRRGRSGGFNEGIPRSTNGQG